MKTPIKVSIKVQRMIRTLSRMPILNYSTLKQDISLYSPIILWEFNYFIIPRFKISCFVLYLCRPRQFQLCSINRLSKLSFIIFRIYLRFGFELAWHKLWGFSFLLLALLNTYGTAFGQAVLFDENCSLIGSNI